MKKFVTLSVMATITIISIVPSAQAQFHNRTNGYGYGSANNINVIQRQLQARINTGIASGRINPQEAARLQSKAAQIDSLEARMRATDGRLSYKERDKLNKELSKFSAQINRELNDFEHRRLGYWNGNNGNNRRWR